MTNRFSDRDRELVSLIAQSLAPKPAVDAGTDNPWGDADQIRRLQALDLPAREWVHACVEIFVQSAEGNKELSEGLDYLGADPDAYAEWADAWICASVVDDNESASDWVEQRLSDVLHDRIVDNTDDYDLAFTAVTALEDWAESLDFASLGEKFIGLAQSGPRNVAGQTCYDALVEAGFLEANYAR